MHRPLGSPRARTRSFLLAGGALATGFLVYSFFTYAPTPPPTAPSAVATPRRHPALVIRAGTEAYVAALASRIIPPVPMPGDDTPSRHQDGPRTRWLHEWATRDFEAALAWAREQSPELRDWTLGRLSLVLAETDPEIALRFCEDEGLTERSIGTTSAVLQMHASASSAEAFSWVLALPEGPLRSQCAPRLFAELAVRAPDLAGSLVAHAGGEGGDADGIHELVEHWTRLAPETAADWLIKQSDADWQTGAVTTLVARWAKDDTAAAERWIAQLPDNANKARAREAFNLHRNRAPDPNP